MPQIVLTRRGEFGNLIVFERKRPRGDFTLTKYVVGDRDGRMLEDFRHKRDAMMWAARNCSQWVWIRYGDACDYSQFNDLNECARDAAEWVPEPQITWVDRGFTARGYAGRNYVSLFWGDAEAQFIRDVDADEREAFVQHLERVYRQIENRKEHP